MENARRAITAKQEIRPLPHVMKAPIILLRVRALVYSAHQENTADQKDFLALQVHAWKVTSAREAIPHITGKARVIPNWDTALSGR